MPFAFLLTRRHLFASMASPALIPSKTVSQPVAPRPAVVPVVPAAPPNITDFSELSFSTSTSYYLKQSLQLGEMATDMLQREDMGGFYQRAFLSKLLEAYDASVQLIEDDFIRTILQRGLAHPMSPEIEEEESGRFI